MLNREEIPRRVTQDADVGVTQEINKTTSFPGYSKKHKGKGRKENV